MVVEFETVEGPKKIEFELVPAEEAKIPKAKRRAAKIPGGPKGFQAPPLEDSGGYCSYEEKEWKVYLDENDNPIRVTVQGIDLNVNYKAWW